MSEPTVSDATLADLIANAPGTAAELMPLVLHRDIVERGWSHQIRHHGFLSLYITERGSGIHVIDGVRYGIARGDVYVMGAGSAHTFAEGDQLALQAIHFEREVLDAGSWEALETVSGFDALLVQAPRSRRLHLPPATYGQVASDLFELSAEWLDGTACGALLVRALFVRLLVRLARFAAGEAPPLRVPQTSRHDREEIVAAAVRTIDLHYAEPLRVAQLAADAYLSPDRFTEIFTSVMGRTPRDYIRHVRIERARTMLAAGGASISDVARAAGFADSGYFSRVFRSETGSSPRSFRQSLRG